MTRHEELQDKYEDALFALLMDDIATALGKEAEEENERLKNNSDFVIPEDVDRRCLQTIRRSFARQKAYSAGRIAVKVVKRAVMAAGIAALLFTGAFAASETVRTATLNVVYEVFETKTRFHFFSQGDSAYPQFAVGWIPGGYTLTQQGSDMVSTWMWYENAENDYISVVCTKTDDTTVSVDTENSTVEYVDINGLKAMLIEKDYYQLVWTANNNSLFIHIVGSEISREDILRVAMELKF